MIDLTEVPEAELRGELSRREKLRSEAARAALNLKYGPCPECGGDIVVFTMQQVEEFKTAPGWNAWPVPPPEHLVRREGGRYEITIICPNDHVRREEQVIFMEQKK